MKKRTSKKAAILRVLLLLPVLTLLFISFTEIKTVEIKSKEIIPDKVASKSEETKREVYQKAIVQNFVEWENPKKYALWLDKKSIANTELKNYKPSQIAHFVLSFVYENARSTRYPQPYQVHLYTENGLAEIVAKNANRINININSNGEILLENDVVTLEEMKISLLRLNNALTQKEREQQVSAFINVAPDTPKAIIKEVDRIVTDYGVAQINIEGQEPLYIGILKENKTEQSPIEKYNTLAKKYNAVPITNRKIPLSELKVLESVYKKMSNEQKANAQPFPECIKKNIPQAGVSKELLEEYNKIAKSHNLWSDFKLGPRKSEIKKLNRIYGQMSDEQRSNAEVFPNYRQLGGTQDGASRDQMTAYNTLAKKYNEMDGDRMRILKSDLERLEYIYSLMSDKQKDDAEPLPDFPEPPPAPESPYARAEASERIGQIIKTQDPYDVVEGNIRINKPNSPKTANSPLRGTTKELQKTSKSLQKEAKQLQKENSKLQKEAIQLQGQAKELNNIPTPPLPPEPLSPLDHVIEMAKKGAAFFYEGKEISSDEAIQLMKNNKNLNIDSRTTNGKKPVVKITVAPVYH